MSIENNFVPEKYLNIRKAIANVLLGVSNANVLMIGDSTYCGFNEAGTANEIAFSTPRQLAALLSAGGLSAGWQNILGDHGNSYAGLPGVPTLDNRVTIGANWTAFDGGSGGIGGGLFFSQNASATKFQFTPTVNTDTCDIYYLDVAGYDNITVTSGVGGVSAPSTGGTIAITGSGTFKKATATNTLGANIWGVQKANANTNNLILQGVNCYNSAAKEISILNCGVSSQNVAYFASTANFWAALSEITGTAPLAGAPLAIIQIGINDWIAGITQAAFQASLGAIVAALQAVKTDVLLVSPIPSANANATLANQAAIVAAYYGVAAQYNCALIDMTKRWISNAVSQPLGYYRGGSDVHGSKLGYEDNAMAINEFFMRLGA